MKKVLLLKNVMEDMDIGIYSTIDKAKDKLIKIFNKNISNIENRAFLLDFFKNLCPGGGFFSPGPTKLSHFSLNFHIN